MIVRALIVNHEPEAGQRLAALLHAEPHLFVLGVCGNVAEAVVAISSGKPDLLFLEADLPGLAQLAAARNAAVDPPLVVLLSSRDAYPSGAFELHALDCLLEPVSIDHLRRALARAHDQLRRRTSAVGTAAVHPGNGHGSATAAVEASPGQWLDRLAVKCPGRVFFLKLEDVDWLEAAGNYVVVYAGQERHIIRETMVSLDSRLDPARFLRIHRSRIVNVDRIKELRPLDGGEYVVVLHSGARLASSRTYRDKLHARLGL